MSGRSICYAAYVEDRGWLPYVCDGQYAGTIGEGRRIEEIALETFNVGGICADAHIENIGWQGWKCGADQTTFAVGTTGKSLRLEAIDLLPGRAMLSNGYVWARSYLQDYGWGGWQWGPVVMSGTTGQGRRMEAIRIEVNQPSDL